MIYPIWKQLWSLVKQKSQVKLNIDICENLKDGLRALEVSKTFDCIYLQEAESEVTADQMPFLLNSICCRELWLFQMLPRDRAYQHPLKQKRIWLEHVEWLSLDALVMSERIELNIREDSISDADLNFVLKTWIQGGLPNLQQFKMEKSWGSHHSKDSIMNGIPYLPFYEPEKPKYSLVDPKFQVDKYRSGFDVERNDGLCATVVIDDNRRSVEEAIMAGLPVREAGRIELFVWHAEYKLL